MDLLIEKTENRSYHYIVMEVKKIWLQVKCKKNQQQIDSIVDAKLLLISLHQRLIKATITYKKRIFLFFCRFSINSTHSIPTFIFA